MCLRSHVASVDGECGGRSRGSRTRAEAKDYIYGIFMALFMALRGKHDEIKQHVPSQAGPSCFYRQTLCQAPSTRPQ